MLLRDPVHGLITFEHEEESIVPRLLATREVQRLRRIRQLGLTCLAFPGADHTRFSHALGAAHVMQRFIARLRQIHGDLPFWQRLTSERARDGLAAALLHDLGHGPLSHLFEDALSAVASGVGPSARRPSTAPAAPGSESGIGDAVINRSHETWTELIVLNPDTDVHRVLIEDDPELPRRVARLIHGGTGSSSADDGQLPYLARAVSGTFDVDRCDYLLRDAHSTGVRYGEYDLPWLLRSLRFAEPIDGQAPGLAIDGTKGLSAIESFIMARLFMFQQVYFHKSTRAAEWMIRSILARAIELLQDGTPLERVPPAIRSIAAGVPPKLGDYLDLDDQVLLEAINTWRSARDPVLADLCTRLRERALFKSIELFGQAATPSRRDEIEEAARDIARERGLDPYLYCGVDTAEDTPYCDDSSLSVIYPRGRQRRPAEVSFVLDRLRDETLTRVRIILAPELRDPVCDALSL